MQPFKAFWPNPSSTAAEASTLPEALIKLSSDQIRPTNKDASELEITQLGCISSTHSAVLSDHSLTLCNIFYNITWLCILFARGGTWQKATESRGQKVEGSQGLLHVSWTLHSWRLLKLCGGNSNMCRNLFQKPFPAIREQQQYADECQSEVIQVERRPLMLAVRVVRA